MLQPLLKDVRSLAQLDDLLDDALRRVPQVRQLGRPRCGLRDYTSSAANCGIRCCGRRGSATRIQLLLTAVM